MRRKGHRGAVLIPSGFAEDGQRGAARRRSSASAQEYNVRLMGPNIYGFYYTPKNLCATFCTAYTCEGRSRSPRSRAGSAWRSSASAARRRWAFRRSSGVGNKSDIDEDDLLTFFEQDDNTQVIAQHFEDLKDGRAFAEAASAGLEDEAGDRAQGGPHRRGARAASSHTGALAGNDKVYDDILKSAA